MGRGGDPACYSLADVAAHTSEEDCWLVIHGQVRGERRRTADSGRRKRKSLTAPWRSRRSTT